MFSNSDLHIISKFALWWISYQRTVSTMVSTEMPESRQRGQGPARGVEPKGPILGSRVKVEHGFTVFLAMSHRET